MEIYGTYKETCFRDESNGYTIFKLELSEFIPEFKDRFITCKGTLSSMFMCLPIKLTGEKVIDGKFESFCFTEVEPDVKNEKEAVKFLSSSCCKGISERLAEAIVKVVGDDIFSLADNPDAYSILTSIDEIGCGKAKNILNAITQAKHQTKLLKEIQEYGGTYLTAEKILIQYGANALQALNRNPYKVGMDNGMSFMACDVMAKDKGFTESSYERLIALILHVISKDYQNGNAYITGDRLYKNVQYFSKKKSAFPNGEISTYQIICACDSLSDIKTEFIDDEVRYYFQKSFEDEMKTAQNIHRFQRNKKKNKIDVKRLISQCEHDLEITYSERQKECFKFLTSNGIKVITGGPGTGKSTVINGLIYAFQKLYPDKEIAMMAPTGRAAQRICEITGHSAGTIHRMLGICPFENNRVFCNYYADYPADMIIVDESSMIDNELMALLTDCLKSNCLVIFVGDIDQLPSIGAGSVLRDMIKAKIETVTLDVNYRQKGKSIIIDNAIAVNNGISDLKTDDSFVIEKFYDPIKIKEKVNSLFISMYDKSNPYSVQILCPQIKGKAGTYAINKAIQQNLKTGRTFIANKYSQFNIGDKVMATINNYEHDYYNGDIGIITDANEVRFSIKFPTKSISVPRENIQDFQLAYACSIHKSQGSEYDVIIICFPTEAQNMLKRNLLYTAITRAKKKVYILTQDGCIEAAVEKTTTATRTSALAERILNL